MPARRALPVLVGVIAMAVAAPAAVAQDEEVVRTKAVVTQSVKVRVSVVTAGTKVFVRSERKGEQLDQVRVKGAQAGEGSELLDFAYARFDKEGEPTKKRSGTGQLTVGWQNPGSRSVTRYVGVRKDGLDAFT